MDTHTHTITCNPPAPFASFIPSHRLLLPLSQCLGGPQSAAGMMDSRLISKANGSSLWLHGGALQRPSCPSDGAKWPATVLRKRRRRYSPGAWAPRRISTCCKFINIVICTLKHEYCCSERFEILTEKQSPMASLRNHSLFTSQSTDSQLSLIKYRTKPSNREELMRHPSNVTPHTFKNVSWWFTISPWKVPHHLMIVEIVSSDSTKSFMTFSELYF